MRVNSASRLRFQDGREAVEYKDMRGQIELLQMLHDARTLDAYQKVGEHDGCQLESWQFVSASRVRGRFKLITSVVLFYS